MTMHGTTGSTQKNKYKSIDKTVYGLLQLNGKTSKTFKIKTGVKQGDGLGPLKKSRS